MMVYIPYYSLQSSLTKHSRSNYPNVTSLKVSPHLRTIYLALQSPHAHCYCLLSSHKRNTAICSCGNRSTSQNLALLQPQGQLSLSLVVRCVLSLSSIVALFGTVFIIDSIIIIVPQGIFRFSIVVVQSSEAAVKIIINNQSILWLTFFHRGSDYKRKQTGAHDK